MAEIKESKAGTGDDGGIGRRKKKLTKEEMAANDLWDLGPYFIKLLWEEPFFYSVYRYCNRIQDRKHVPTAGVTIIKDRPTLLWNPDFMSTLKPKEVLGVLKHEAYHLIYNHCTGRRKDPHFIWNWAADLSINGTLGLDELPSGCLYPSRALAMPAQEDWDEMKPEEQARFMKISALLESFPIGKAAEWYYEKLMDDPEVKQMVKEAAEAKERGEEWAKAIGKAIADAMNGGGGHEGWGMATDEDGNEIELPDGVRQMIEGEIRQQLRDAVGRCDGGNSWGSVPAHMQEHIRSLVSNEVDWRAVMRQFVGMSRRSDSRNSRKKVNRKIPYAFPGRTRNYTANVAVYVDQSGSVNDVSLALLYAELRQLSRRTTFHFYPFDTQVDEANGFVWKKGQSKPDLERFRCGGTNFQACVDHVNRNRDRFDACVIMSDGECSKPTSSRVRLAYIICPDRKLLFTPDPENIVIQMKNDKVKD